MLNTQKDLITLYGKTYTAEQIANEKDEYVRLEAVDYYFALNQLVTDRSPLVRTAVARKKVGHDRLVFDENWRVRATVAQHCTDQEIIDILIQDENDFVRYIIAKRGFGAEQLANDPDDEIASIARYTMQQLQAA